MLDKEDGIGIVGSNQGENRQGYIPWSKVEAIAGVLST
jgi:hypothetical protein